MLIYLERHFAANYASIFTIIASGPVFGDNYQTNSTKLYENAKTCSINHKEVEFFKFLIIDQDLYSYILDNIPPRNREVW